MTDETKPKDGALRINTTGDGDLFRVYRDGEWRSAVVIDRAVLERGQWHMTSGGGRFCLECDAGEHEQAHRADCPIGAALGSKA